MIRAHSSTRHLATVLFTDIVGSTGHAAELGDRRWRELLAEHHRRIRRELERYGGREVATAGDGFVAAFAEPEPALHCACAIRNAVRNLGLEIRAGLHLGTLEEQGAEIGGIAVHIGARVAALAGASEVLLSATVRDAVVGSGFEFEDRGVHSLKGVPGEWRVYAVVGVPEAVVPGSRPSDRIRRRRALAIAAAVLAAVTLLVLGRAWVPDAEGPRSPPGTAASPGQATAGAPAARDSAPPATPPGAITMAVLPFEPLTSDPRLAFLEIGIPDAIITKLANARTLRMRPTSAVLRYAEGLVDVREAGRALSSEYVLTGTLQRLEDRLRVNVQLVRVADGSSLWGSAYELRELDLLDLQDSVAARVAGALQLRMTEEEIERLYRRHTENLAAHEAYLEGRAELVRYNAPSVAAAVRAFERALRLDDHNALAHAGLAMASAQMSRYVSEDEVPAWTRRARASARRALAIEPRLAEAHEAFAAVYRNAEFDWERTIEESRRALELNPALDLPHTYLSAALLHLGLLHEADVEARLALETNPDAVEPVRLQGTVSLYEGRAAEAVPRLEEALRRSRGPIADWYLAQALYYAGDGAAAEAMLEKLGGRASTERRAQATLASFRAAAGDTVRARGLVRKVLAAPYRDHHVTYSLGAAYAQLGSEEEAVRWLRESADTGFPCLPWYERDPLLLPLGDSSDFRALLEDLRRRHATSERRYVGSRRDVHVS